MILANKRNKVIFGGLAIFLFLVGLINLVVLCTGLKVTARAVTPTALIFGGGLKDTGEQSDFEFDRVQTGIDLYKAGRVNKIIMTGDDGARWGNEVQAMKLMALKAGLPPDAVAIDPHGYRTYDSCWRAKNIYGLNSAVVVSQNFHLARIKYLCKHFGLTAYGASADMRPYGFGMVKAQTREILARVKAWLDLYIVAPPVSKEKY